MHDDYFDFVEQLYDTDQITAKPRALEGLRVLDLSHMIFGPTAARVLAQYGAEVIKVELPFTGDYWRSSTYWGKYWKHSNPLWNFINHSKYFVAIDVKEPRGREMILQLAEKSDVVIENFSPGTVEAWGIGYSTLSAKNPKIVYASCSTFGQYGPFRYFPGWDLLAQGASGMLSATGYEGTDQYFKIPDFYGDFCPGLYSAMMIVMGRNDRARKGKGQYMDICQAEILMRALPHFSYFKSMGEDIGRTGGHDPAMSPSGIFKAAQGAFVALAIASDAQFQGLCSAMEKPELGQDSRFSKALDRLKPENAAAIEQLVAQWVSGLAVDGLMSLAQTHGFPAAPVRDDLEISEERWRQERGNVVVFDDPMYGKLKLESTTVRLSATPARIQWLTRPLGYHNRYIFKSLLGLSEDRIRELEKARVVGYWDYRVGQRPPVYYDIENDPIFNYQDGNNG
ncbi:MAG: CoA transferase [Desulfatitalea sp.]|nr:CoA transferase [Desulfatitalea sp.]